MYFKNIYIRDFGIFNNQKLDDLSENIVVVGGKNRAGKSSFLDIIRYLGYGLPQDDSIPPALNQYYVEADLESEGENYNLTLNGYAKPEIIDSSGQNFSAGELYNNLDQLSYQQLFTISLDELQQLSKVVKGKKNRKRLYSILLGAGLSELIRIPEIADQYFKNAYNIGAKLGDPAVSSFKPYFNEIKEAEKKRDQALNEIDEFNNKRDQLQEKENALKELKSDLDFYKREEFLLDLLKNNYKAIQKIEDLELELKENQKNEIKDFKQSALEKIESYQEAYLSKNKILKDKRKTIEKISKAEKLDKFVELFLKEKGAVKYFKSKKEVLKERVNNLIENEMKIDHNFTLLKNELQELNSNWEKPLQELKNIEIDSIKQQQLSKNIDQYNKLQTKFEEMLNRKEEIEHKITEKNAEIDNYNFTKTKDILKRTYTAFISAAVIGIISLSFDFYPFFYFSLILILTAIIYYNSNYKSSKMKEENLKKLKDDNFKLKSELNNLGIKIKEKKSELEKSKKELDNYAEILGLEDENYLSLLSDYYRQIQDKKSRFRLLEAEKAETEVKRENLREELSRLFNLVNNIADNSQTEFFSNLSDKNSLFEQSEQLFNDLDQIYDLSLDVQNYCQIKDEYIELKEEIEDFLGNYKKEEILGERLNQYLAELKKSEDYQKIEAEYQKEKRQLQYTLNSSDKIKKYLTKKSSDSKANSFQIFIDLYKNYSSPTAVEKEHQKINQELIVLDDKKEELENEITTLNNQIDVLSSSDKVEKAQDEINQARNNLRRLAENYAVNKSVYFILNKLRSRMISRAENELLKPAADILARITENEYQAVETAADLEKTEFKIVNAEGESFDNADYLSRGTLEQLFLAVRISRILEIKPPLPIVLDDSLVNFDRSHLYHTAEIISELAAEHQIFILTCHPHLIKYISNISDSAQYWKLESGEFEKSNQEKLIDHLNCCYN